MKMIPSAMLVLTLVPLSACAPKVNIPADVQAIKQSVDAYCKGHQCQGRNRRSAPMLTDKTGWTSSLTCRLVAGKDAVAKFTKRLFEPVQSSR